MSQALRVLSLARTEALKMQPYMATSIYMLVPVAVTEIATMGVTAGGVLYFNEKFVLDYDAKTIGGVLLHEVHHLLRDHPNRLVDAAFADIRNIAFDIPINDDLLAMGVPLPDFAVTSQKQELPPGKTSEEYYALLIEKHAQEKTKSDTAPTKSEDAQGASKDTTGSPGNNTQNPKERARVTAGGCGGIAGNKIKALEEQLDAKYGRKPAGIAAKRKECLKEIAASKAAGKMPGELTEIIRRMHEASKVPWHRYVRQLAYNEIATIVSGLDDYSYRIPSRRALTRDDNIVYPSMVSSAPTILVCLDTSASMDETALSKALREMTAILQNLPIGTLLLLEADYKIAIKPRTIKAGDLQNLKVSGRGGTSFIPAFEYVEKMRPPPDLIIYITDGYGDAPEQPPKQKVIWCIIDGRPPVKWGTVVRVE